MALRLKVLKKKVPFYPELEVVPFVLFSLKPSVNFKISKLVCYKRITHFAC